MTRTDMLTLAQMEGLLMLPRDGRWMIVENPDEAPSVLLWTSEYVEHRVVDGEDQARLTGAGQQRVDKILSRSRDES